MPTEQVLEKVHCSGWSFWVVFLCADYTRRKREHITEVSLFMELVLLCEALSAEKLQAEKNKIACDCV